MRQFLFFFANKVRHKKTVHQSGKVKHDQPNIQRVVTSSASLPINYTYRQPLELLSQELAWVTSRVMTATLPQGTRIKCGETTQSQLKSMESQLKF